MTQIEDSAVTPLPEGSMIGLVGGGQLGMFFTQAAQRLGYRVCCFCNHADEPAARYADEVICGSFEDEASIESLVRQCQAVTYEFESIPPSTLASIDQKTALMPSLAVVQTTQNRAFEKSFLKEHSIPTADFAIVDTFDSLVAALKSLDSSAVLKTARDGYDGKGQWKLRGDETPDELSSIWGEVDNRKCTLERLIDLDYEVSMIVAGDQHGNFETIGPIHNQHVNHILDTSWIDHAVDQVVADRIREMSIELAKQFSLVGTFCVEFFVSKSGMILVNEIAPRPHNSGHLTIDSFSLSQFDMQALAVTGHELSESVELESAVMVNLLGDLWTDGDPNFELAAKELDCDVHLHLYGKSDARPGRKMGHATVIANTQDQAIESAKRYRDLLHQRQTTSERI
jgi:5-(carboxyamino)imidazole ribonucleotide synthase